MVYKLHISNIPFTCTKYEIENIMKKFEGFVKCSLTKLKHSKLNKGFGVVEFDTLKNCIKVLNNKSIKICNRHVKCNYYIDKSLYINPLYKLPNTSLNTSPNTSPKYNDKNNYKLNNYVEMFKNMENIYNEYTKNLILS